MFIVTAITNQFKLRRSEIKGAIYIALLRSCKPERTGFYKPESCVKKDHIFNLSIFFMADVKASLYKKLAGNFSVGLLSDVVSSLGTSNKRERNVAKVMR